VVNRRQPRKMNSWTTDFPRIVVSPSVRRGEVVLELELALLY